MAYLSDWANPDFKPDEVPTMRQLYGALGNDILPGLLATAVIASAFLAHKSYIGHGEFASIGGGATRHIYGRPTEERYHSITQLEEGFMGELGATQTLMDRDGQPIISGFHVIARTQDGWHGEYRSGNYYFSVEGEFQSEISDVGPGWEIFDPGPGWGRHKSNQFVERRFESQRSNPAFEWRNNKLDDIVSD